MVTYLSRKDVLWNGVLWQGLSLVICSHLCTCFVCQLACPLLQPLHVCQDRPPPLLQLKFRAHCSRGACHGPLTDTSQINLDPADLLQHENSLPEARETLVKTKLKSRCGWEDVHFSIQALWLLNCVNICQGILISFAWVTAISKMPFCIPRTHLSEHTPACA